MSTHLASCGPRPLQDPEWRSAAFGPTVELQVRVLASYPATPVAVEVVAPSMLPRVLAAVEGGFATEAAALAATRRPDALRCLLRFVDNHIGRLAAEAVSVCSRGASCVVNREPSSHRIRSPTGTHLSAADWHAFHWLTPQMARPAQPKEWAFLDERSAAKEQEEEEAPRTQALPPTSSAASETEATAEGTQEGAEQSVSGDMSEAMGSLEVAQADEGTSSELTMLGSHPVHLQLDALKLNHVHTLLTSLLRVLSGCVILNNPDMRPDDGIRLPDRGGGGGTAEAAVRVRSMRGVVRRHVRAHRGRRARSGASW
jgi:hypothetical protein